MENTPIHTADAVLNESYDFFKGQGISILGEGYKEIATDVSLFESYVGSLTEGCSANDTVAISEIMRNTNYGLLKESSMTGIQPIASLSMPIIRKLWPKFAIKEALKTEVAKSPRFVVSYTKPYLINSSGVKTYLPKGLIDSSGAASDALGKEFTGYVTKVLSGGAASVVDFTSDAHVTLSGSSSAIKVQPLDELDLSEVALYVLDATATTGIYTIADGVVTYVGTATATATNYVKVSQKIGEKLGVKGTGVYDLSDGGQLIVKFDGANDKVTFAFIAGVSTNVLSIKCRAGISSEYNEEGESLGFDISRQDIDIPTGQHINAPLPIESLNDMMALYQIDGTKETVDLMTNTFAMKLDLDALTFIKHSFANQPGNKEFADYGDASAFSLVFNCRPMPGFAGTPKAWREELKPQIDYLAQKIKNATYLTTGTFSIIANPLDAAVLANIDWQFRGGQGGNVDGVSVDYSVGTYIGANTYKVISSTNVPTGAMYILFTPTSETQMTYKYYPYTFSTEMGYIDPNRSRIPSIMMTKRQAFAEFMPACGVIIINGNDGTPYNTAVSTAAWTTADAAYPAD